MADRQISFSPAMVRALLEGRKTQTRRVLKLHPSIEGKRFVVFPPEEVIELQGGEFRQGICHYASTGALSGPYRLPYAVGDRLYVREAWHAARSLNRTRPRDIPRDADIEHAATARSYAEIGLKGKLRPAMFLPRWASRLTLIVTDVRVERLNSVSREDAIAEGIERVGGGILRWEKWASGIEGVHGFSPEAAYALLWNHLNAKRGFGWETNPWVVAVSFTVHQRNIDEMGRA